MEKIKRYTPYFKKFSEELRLTDLKKHSGISAFTQPFMKDRQKLKGQNSASLIDCNINPQENWVEFEFRSGVTYPAESPHYKVNKNTHALQKNPSKTYIEYIRILDFFDWLSTNPEYEEIHSKVIKEILQVSAIQVFCTCASYQYQGFNWQISSNFDGSVYPTDIPDPIWGARHNNGDGLVCKHLDLIINQIEFWYNPLSSMLTKKLKDRNLI